MSSWYNNEKSEGGVCVSSRIRLARNLEGLPFPAGMEKQDFQSLNERIKNAITNSNTPFAKSLKYIEMNDIPANEILAMVERHIISPEFAEKSRDKAIIISEDESVCVMIGEEDHIRIQVLYEGLSLEMAYQKADELDNLLSSALPVAFDNRLGYLTECPTNLGTGLRASVMLHLPMLEATGEISIISDSLNKIGFTVRGMYGEGSRTAASLYQLSNQITLGISEKDALNNLLTIAKQIIEKEVSARQNSNTINLEDKVCRALGILQNARMLSSAEMMQHISLIKLGIDMGIIKKEKFLPVKILIEAQKSMLMRSSGELDTEQRDIKRAELVRNSLC